MHGRQGPDSLVLTRTGSGDSIICTVGRRPVMMGVTLGSRERDANTAATGAGNRVNTVGSID